MLAKLSDTVPEGAFLYEPKWDGFRALVFRDGDSVVVRSRNDRPLERYFPELLEGLRVAKVDPADTSRAIEALRARPDVIYAEPNYIRRALVAPNDPPDPAPGG